MSALTEQVAREHQRIFNAQYGLGPHCICGWTHPGYDGSQKHVRHVAEVTEAAVRAAVAAEIRDRLNTADLIRLADTYSGYYQGVRAGYQDAIEIVGGKP